MITTKTVINGKQAFECLRCVYAETVRIEENPVHEQKLSRPRAQV
jgi:hypothetical protein